MGVLYIGALLAMALWGASGIQLFQYYTTYPNDSVALKIFVFAVWALDTAHQGLITHTTYKYLISNFGDDAYLDVVVRSVLDMTLISALICLAVQGFFLNRVWKLSRRNIFATVFLASLVLTEFAVAIVFYAKALHFRTFEGLSSIFWLAKTMDALCAVPDTAITIALFYFLNRSRTGFARSEAVVNKIILFSFNTGLFTALCALASFISIEVWPQSRLYLLFYYLISRLYTNSLLVSYAQRAKQPSKQLTGRRFRSPPPLAHLILERVRTHDAFLPRRR
ncbi:hypothetical protein SCHPADRAFT_405731 [Schizopora paradoxa]|uniref:DUF6534 domain-containing protein n=1 Tax=Schizopora paradoxa TaxID=27342 RepID=A0A0H2RM27_9AGAM|nr:hypothetical protein SCHPADRAFT_405731 [Schizopora paradoxa]